ncbi:MAG TPA: PA domain-containing protein [Solirubrobacteraceae bacterium]|nr:PA domain-containing protein [Solirubrobacteraceae bacterium]
MRRGSIGAAFAATLLFVAVLAQTAAAQQRLPALGMQTDGGGLPQSAAAPLPPLTAGLAPTEKNVELVGKVELKGRFGNVDPGQIADLSHKGNYAYLNSWQSQSRGRCDRGGVFVVDISNPANPTEVGFIPSPIGTYPGEGSHVVAIDTPAFKGDLLTINNEACLDPASTPDTLLGGITLVDVTNPLAPVILAQGVGDTTPSAAIPGVKNSPVHLSHSAFTWQAGQKAYTVLVDNEPFVGATEYIDILDVTNPRSPQLINELDLQDPTTQVGTVNGTAYGDVVNLHDMIVKEIGGRQIMLASYWDGGYVQLDVTDPENVVLINDSDFAGLDPIFQDFAPPEGNAHQAEYSRDNRFVLAADEDFGPFRGRLTTSAGAFNLAEPTDATVPVETLAGGQLVSEDVVFVGRACNLTGTPVPDTVLTAPPADGNPDTYRVAVIERGLCFFDEKVQAVEDAGWDAWVVMNNTPRPDGDPLLTNGSIDHESIPGIAILPGGYITRADAIAGIFGGTAPVVGTLGLPITISTAFDGWGYAHLFDRATMTRLDSWAPPEARDPRFARDFGDLSIHEHAVDPAADLSYVAYYKAGFRVLSFGAGTLSEVGRFIDGRGNNIWGVDVAADSSGGRLILASDRDYGLYILRYTGPGAVTAPATPPPPPPPPVAQQQPPPPAAQPSSFFKFGKTSRLTFRKGKATLRITVPGPGRLTAALKLGIGRKALVISRASKTATKSGTVTLTFRLSAKNARLLRRSLARRPSHRTRGVAQVTYRPTGGNKRTRNKALSIGMR